jgi:hypothetical protein
MGVSKQSVPLLADSSRGVGDTGACVHHDAQRVG